MKNELEIRTKNFALEIIRLVGGFQKSKSADVIGYQLLKSGTSIGANYREATRAQSKNDFIHKIAICEKEAAETEYWMELVIEAKISPQDIERLLDESRQLLAIFVSSGKTAKANR